MNINVRRLNEIAEKTSSQAAYLYMLLRNYNGIVTVSTLAKDMHMTRRNIYYLLDKLTDNGLIVRLENGGFGLNGTR